MTFAQIITVREMRRHRSRTHHDILSVAGVPWRDVAQGLLDLEDIHSYPIAQAG
jgi:hypothetical protein